MALLIGLSFLVGTLLSWWALSRGLTRKATVEKRLRTHATGYTQLVSASEDGESLVGSARNLAVRSATTKAPKDPIKRLFWIRQQNKRKAAFVKQIVDALTLMASSLRAGYSFLQAIEMVSKEMSAPLGEEFAHAVHEMSLGATVEESLQEMVRRVPLEELSLVVTAVIVQRQVGGNLAEVLETIAHTVRERIRIQGEIQTLTAQGRISGFIVGGLPAALTLMISAINPVYMSALITSPIGWALIGMGLTGQLIGVLAIRKIIRIEV